MTSPPPPRASRPWLERLQDHAPLLLVLGATVMCAVVYHHVFAGEFYGDDNTFHLAEAVRLRDCLVHHDWDWWNPNANGGYASAYYYQVLPQLFPALGSAIFGGSVLFWFQLGVFLPLVLTPAATYRAMRVFGASPWESAVAALVLPLTISTSKWGFGADGTFSVGLYTQTWAMAAFPLALAHGARWIDERRGLGAAVAWGLLVGLCHPFAGISVGVALAAGEIGRALARAGRRALRAAGVDVAPPADDVRPLGALWRLSILGALLLVGSASAWLTVLVDYNGFGGFPHRVGGEDGLGFIGLYRFVSRGELLDARAGVFGGHGALLHFVGQAAVLTYLIPIVAIMFRPRWVSRLWSAAIAYALFLAVGPHLKTQDDPFPAIRFLGSLQVVLAMLVGAGATAVVIEAWKACEGRRWEVWLRAALGAVAGAALGLVCMGADAQAGRVWVAADAPGVHRDELARMFPVIARADQGRKQAGAGATSHFANQLPYVYAGRDAMLQMGGAGLQASPNYVYLWNQQTPLRSAWIYDAPLVLYSLDKVNEVPGGEVLFKTPHLGLKWFPAPGLVSPVQVVGTLPPGRKAERAAGLKWLKSLQPMKNQVLAHAGSGGAGPPPEGVVIAYSRQPSPGDEPDITAVVEASAPTTFEVHESWHPRWHAFIDGKAAPVRRITPDFMAVDVPPGRHDLAFRFDRPWWAWAVWLLWPGAILAGWWIARRRGATAPSSAAPA